MKNYGIQGWNEIKPGEEAIIKDEVKFFGAYKIQSASGRTKGLRKRKSVATQTISHINERRLLAFQAFRDEAALDWSQFWFS